jgi:hypothetical protein
MIAARSGERKAYEQLLRELDNWLRLRPLFVKQRLPLAPPQAEPFADLKLLLKLDRARQNLEYWRCSFDGRLYDQG